MNSIWTEKYRPSDFDEVMGQDEIIKRIKSFVEKGNLPHIMFSGPAGTGKTSLAIIIAKKLFRDDWRHNFLDLNASDERGIDIIRNKVKDFARTRAIGNVPFKIIYLDESDSLTKDAQHALRRTMENYAATCRFILSNNYSSKIIEPIQSRCAVFRFRPLDENNLGRIIERISHEEGLEIDSDARSALIRACEGDVRKLENLMQSCSASSTRLTEELVYGAASMAEPKEIKDVISLAIGNRFREARDKLLDIMLAQGMAGIDVIKQIQKEVLDISWDPKKKMQMIEKCGEIEFRMVEGSDEFVQLESLLSSFAVLGP
ncbi:replication factor C small subunit [Candidatus Woesearchaeota archaeon]|nr:replication factor C small subunit [Candidatus Woesearchaeota archaeon]